MRRESRSFLDTKVQAVSTSHKGQHNSESIIVILLAPHEAAAEVFRTTADDN